MKFKPIENITEYYDGLNPLPAGFCPLATSEDGLVGLLASREWAEWNGDALVILPPEIQGRVMKEVVAPMLGGNIKQVSEALGVSYHTFSRWRLGDKLMSSAAAYRVADELAKVLLASSRCPPTPEEKNQSCSETSQAQE